MFTHVCTVVFRKPSGKYEMGSPINFDDGALVAPYFAYIGETMDTKVACDSVEELARIAGIVDAAEWETALQRIRARRNESL